MSKLFSSSVPDERAEALVDRYDLRDLTAPTDGSASFTDGFFFGGWEVEGWSPLRQSTHVVEGRRVHTAVWTKAGAKNEAGDPPVAVKVEVTECASERDARAALLEALDITMSVDVLQRTEDGPGEVALLPRSKDEPATGLFVRSNCLVRVSNAEREVVPVNTFFQVDRLFFGPVEAVSNAAAPDEAHLAGGHPAHHRVGEKAPPRLRLGLECLGHPGPRCRRAAGKRQQGGDDRGYRELSHPRDIGAPRPAAMMRVKPGLPRYRPSSARTTPTPTDSTTETRIALVTGMNMVVLSRSITMSPGSRPSPSRVSGPQSSPSRTSATPAMMRNRAMAAG